MHELGTQFYGYRARWRMDGVNSAAHALSTFEDYRANSRPVEDACRC
jgi:hypothetical protein